MAAIEAQIAGRTCAPIARCVNKFQRTCKSLALYRLRKTFFYHLFDRKRLKLTTENAFKHKGKITSDRIDTMLFHLGKREREREYQGA